MSTNMLNISEGEARLTVLCLLLIIWELIRKGIALYKAGQNSDKIRFVLIFIFNTCGVLPIVYLILQRNKNI